MPADYRAPLADMQFILHELIPFSTINSLPPYQEVSDDLVNTILEEASKFAWGDITNGLAVIAQMDFGFAICVVLLFQSASIAAQMGNGMAVSSLEVGGMLSKIKNPLTGGPQKIGKWAGNKIKGKVGNAIKSRWNKR